MFCFNYCIPAFAVLALVDFSFARVIPRESGAQTQQNNHDALDPARKSLFKFSGPHYSDVAQGMEGDCWLDAVSAAVAFSDWNKLTQMMRDPMSKDGVVSVDLYNAQGQMTTYSIKKDLNEMTKDKYSLPPQYVTGGEYLWPVVMEIAFKRLRQQFSDVGYPEDLNGADPAVGFRAIYGKQAISSSIEAIDDTKLWQYIKGADTWGTPAVASTPSTTTIKAIEAGHAYTIMGGDEGYGTIRLRNPWGFLTQQGDKSHVNDLGDGVFDISVADFRANFHWIAARN